MSPTRLPLVSNVALLLPPILHCPTIRFQFATCLKRCTAPNLQSCVAQLSQECCTLFNCQGLNAQWSWSWCYLSQSCFTATANAPNPQSYNAQLLQRESCTLVNCQGLGGLAPTMVVVHLQRWLYSNSNVDLTPTMVVVQLSGGWIKPASPHLIPNPPFPLPPPWSSLP